MTRITKRIQTHRPKYQQQIFASTQLPTAQIGVTPEFPHSSRWNRQYFLLFVCRDFQFNLREFNSKMSERNIFTQLFPASTHYRDCLCGYVCVCREILYKKKTVLLSHRTYQTAGRHVHPILPLPTLRFIYRGVKSVQHYSRCAEPE